MKFTPVGLRDCALGARPPRVEVARVSRLGVIPVRLGMQFELQAPPPRGIPIGGIGVAVMESVGRGEQRFYEREVRLHVVGVAEISAASYAAAPSRCGFLRASSISACTESHSRMRCSIRPSLRLASGAFGFVVNFLARA